MMATATQVRNQFSRFLELAQTEDIEITKNDCVVAVLRNPREVNREKFLGLRGILKGNTLSLDQLRNERLSVI